jgi:hypothetical protein
LCMTQSGAQLQILSRPASAEAPQEHLHRARCGPRRRLLTCRLRNSHTRTRTRTHTHARTHARTRAHITRTHTNTPTPTHTPIHAPSGLQSIVLSMLRALPQLLSVIVLLFFTFTLFGIFGLQFFSGILHSRCVRAYARKQGLARWCVCTYARTEGLAGRPHRRVKTRCPRSPRLLCSPPVPSLAYRRSHAHPRRTPLAVSSPLHLPQVPADALPGADVMGRQHVGRGAVQVRRPPACPTL